MSQKLPNKLKTSKNYFSSSSCNLIPHQPLLSYIRLHREEHAGRTEKYRLENLSSLNVTAKKKSYCDNAHMKIFIH